MNIIWIHRYDTVYGNWKTSLLIFVVKKKRIPNEKLERKEFTKKSVEKRDMLNKAIYRQKLQSNN